MPSFSAGRVAGRASGRPGGFLLDVRDLTAGVYLVTVSPDRETATRKLVLQE